MAPSVSGAVKRELTDQANIHYTKVWMNATLCTTPKENSLVAKMPAFQPSPSLSPKPASSHQDRKMKRASPAAISLHPPSDDRKKMYSPSAHHIHGYSFAHRAIDGEIPSNKSLLSSAIRNRSLAGTVVFFMTTRSCAAQSKAAGLLAAICQRWHRLSEGRTRLVGR